MSETEYRKTLLDALDANRVSIPIKDLEMQGKNQNYALLLNGAKRLDDIKNVASYDHPDAVEMYQNALSWLFATIQEDEETFRSAAIDELRLAPGQRVLVTGCGLGEDVRECVKRVGLTGLVHAQDLSHAFVEHCANALPQRNVVFTVSNALDLPYRSDFFDAVVHFGGINFFGDIHKAVSEMTRVCKVGGRIVFGDESVAPHLRPTEFGKMVIANSQTWAAPLPLDALPECAAEINLQFVAANCFYIIALSKAEGLPSINPDIVHKGYRGGTMRTRYLGGMEGIDPELKDRLYAFAKDNDLSVSDILTELVSQKITPEK